MRHNELTMDLLVPLHISGSSILLLVLSLPEIAHDHGAKWSIVLSFLPRLPVQPLKGASTAQVHDPDYEIRHKLRWQVPRPMACLKMLPSKDSFTMLTAGESI